MGAQKLTGAERIAAERLRQIEKENWSDMHDDEHDWGELNIAGACYADVAWRQIKGLKTNLENPPKLWPWEDKWWKPSEEPARNLEKAGALFAAEIDRIERKNALQRKINRLKEE